MISPYAWHHLVVLGVSVALVRPLAEARWPWRAPRTALIAWQALTLAGVLSLIGSAIAIGLAPYQRGVLASLAALASDFANGTVPPRITPVRAGVALLGVLAGFWLLTAYATSAWRVARTRRRQRALLHVLASQKDELGGALVIDHPLAAAYCLPGRPARVVVSTGALGLLTTPHLNAVLDHERAHAREHHHLVTLPFAALCRAVPHSLTVRRAADSVELLVEMLADDLAARRQDATTLAEALRRFGGSTGVVSVRAVAARVDRLAAPVPLPLAARLLVLAAAVVLAATPVSLLVFPP